MDDSDADRLDAWRGGDERAGRELFDRHFASLFRFFRNKIPDAAEDLVQQTLLACVRGRDRFRGAASFRTYLFTIARNRLYTHIRDRGRREQVFSPSTASVADLALEGAVSGAAAMPSQIIAASQEQRLLLSALRRLPLEMQVALELFYWEDLTVREIAEVVEAPEGTVKRRLQRARERLEVLIGELAESDVLARSTVDNLQAWADRLRHDLGREE
jgi:RNA polymerase sigma-70 factor (ECF subfamily)